MTDPNNTPDSPYEVLGEDQNRLSDGSGRMQSLTKMTERLKRGEAPIEAVAQPEPEPPAPAPTESFDDLPSLSSTAVTLDRWQHVHYSLMRAGPPGLAAWIAFRLEKEGLTDTEKSHLLTAEEPNAHFDRLRGYYEAVINGIHRRMKH